MTSSTSPPGTWCPHQDPRISLTMSSASSGLRTASSSRACCSMPSKITETSSGGGGPSPAGSPEERWRLRGLTPPVSQIWRGALPTTPAKAAMGRANGAVSRHIGAMFREFWTVSARRLVGLCCGLALRLRCCVHPARVMPGRPYPVHTPGEHPGERATIPRRLPQMPCGDHQYQQEEPVVDEGGARPPPVWPGGWEGEYLARPEHQKDGPSGECRVQLLPGVELAYWQ